MARTQQAIYNEMITDYVNRVLSVMGVTLIPSEWSTTDNRGLIFWIVAGAMAVLEQLWDAFVVDAHAVATAAPPQTQAWIQKKMFEFQYDATTPQVLQLDTLTALYAYPTIDATLQIIKYCSVVPGALGVTLIKVAKDNAGSPEPLTVAELSAAQSYINTFCVPGLYYIANSAASDKLYVSVDVYYIGQYSSVIQSTVSTAIDAYLAAIPFNGLVDLSDLEVAIKKVTGVVSMVYKDVQARPDSVAALSGTPLVSNYTTVQKDWNTVAGYIVPEVSPNSLTDPRPDGSGLLNLNLIAQ